MSIRYGGVKVSSTEIQGTNSPLWDLANQALHCSVDLTPLTLNNSYLQAER